MTEDCAKMMAQLLGIDIEAERAKHKQEFSDYAHLCATLSIEELGIEIAKHFGEDVHKAAILVAIISRIEAIERRLC